MARDDAFREAVRTEWDRAVAHAGFAADEVALWLCTGFPADQERSGACYYKPLLSIEDERFLSPGQKAEAESDAYWERHRIVLFEDFRAEENDLGETLVAVMGAHLRHELEHARQQAVCGNDVLDIDDFLDRAIRLKAGGLPGSTDLYNQKPMEQDANAAAAMYLRAYHSAHVEAILRGPCPQFARSNAPSEALDTLLARTVACFFQYRDICEADSGDMPFWKRLHACDKRAGVLWRQLEAGGEAGAA
jgi:hypothetical protein